MQKNRPKFLELQKIRLPLPGLLSILHRISGVLMFLSLPFILWLFNRSLHSQASYDSFVAIAGHPIIKVFLIGLVWALLHHLLAGIRYIAMDMHWGVDLPQARASSKLVFGLSLILTVIAGVNLW